MAVFDLYSKRQKMLRGEIHDVYTYDNFNGAFKTQVVHIWQDALGDKRECENFHVHETYCFIVETLCREYGVFKLPRTANNGYRDYIDELVNFFLAEQDFERVLDVVELTFRLIDKNTRLPNYLDRQNSNNLADEAIQELNIRFKEHGYGYQFHDGEIIRIDSELIHSEVVKPALRLLNQKKYAGAQDEFLKAYEHYRHGKSKEALNECLKAFESVMKSICSERGWVCEGGENAKNLIKTCFDKELIPTFWQDSFNSLRNLLACSVPTGRNKLSGHGQGSVPVDVPAHLVSYMLHMTASAIVFLCEADAQLA